VKICEVACPFEPVNSVSLGDGGVVANVPLALVAGAVKVTEILGSGTLLMSVTVATNGLVNAVLTVALCPPPLVARRIAGGPTVLVLVKAKLTCVVVPGVVAVTLYGPPAVESAVHVTDALPLALVVPVVAESTQLAPDKGAANVTVAPLSAVPFEVTFATSGKAKAVPTSALWGDPLATVITVADGAVFVKAKLADAVAPEVEAVTL
jgi:hypothetical protein